MFTIDPIKLQTIRYLYRKTYNPNVSDEQVEALLLGPLDEATVKQYAQATDGTDLNQLIQASLDHDSVEYWVKWLSHL